jgi:hypothetical protein
VSDAPTTVACYTPAGNGAIAPQPVHSLHRQPAPHKNGVPSSGSLNSSPTGC